VGSERDIGRCFGELSMKVRAAGATLVTLVSVYTVFQFQTFSDFACPKISWAPGSSIACGPQYKSVSPEEAGEFLHVYYSAATRTGGPGAWQMLAEDFQREQFNNDRKDYTSALKKTIWNEIVGNPKPGSNRNEFMVHIRHYNQIGVASNGKIRGHVAPYHLLIRLQHTANGLEILSERRKVRDAGGSRLSFEFAYFTKAENLRHLPRFNSEIGMPAEDQYEVGGRLPALCEIRVTKNTAKDPDDVGWWTRTIGGWAKNTQLQRNGRAWGDRPLGILPCDRHVLTLE
jgi:hypothetical protein